MAGTRKRKRKRQKMSEAYEGRVIPSKIAFLLYNINARARKIQWLYDENKADQAKIAELEREQKTRRDAE